MYQDLSFMKVPLPEDVLKLKIYGDYAGAQKMIRYFLEEKDIPQALRKRLEIEQEVIGVMGGNEYPFTYDEALEIMASHLRDFKKEELDHLKEISAADWIYIDGEVHFQRRFYENLIKTRPDLAERVIVENPEDKKENNLKQKLLKRKYTLHEGAWWKNCTYSYTFNDKSQERIRRGRTQGSCTSSDSEGIRAGF